MYNLVKAAEAGWKASIFEALDFELVWNGCSAACDSNYRTDPSCAP
jgi:hypothetical protein